MTDKTPNYSDEQTAIILAAIAANGGVADKALAETLAADPRMNGTDGPRKPRGIIAKMTRMDGVTYTKAAKVSKTGKPVQKKLDLVALIAARADVEAAKLEGLDSAPKLALETLAEALAA